MKMCSANIEVCMCSVKTTLYSFSIHAYRTKNTHTKNKQNMCTVTPLIDTNLYIKYHQKVNLSNKKMHIYLFVIVFICLEDVAELMV